MAGPRPLARTLSKLTAQALGKRGQAFGALIADWSSIMGAELGARAVPVKLALPPGQREGATLHLRVHGAAALEVQHQEPQILERINAFFGYRAVARLKLMQQPPVAAQLPRRRIRPLTPAEEARITAATAGIEDEALRQSLAGLARAMARRGEPGE